MFMFRLVSKETLMKISRLSRCAISMGKLVFPSLIDVQIYFYVLPIQVNFAVLSNLMEIKPCLCHDLGRTNPQEKPNIDAREDLENPEERHIRFELNKIGNNINDCIQKWKEMKVRIGKYKEFVKQMYKEGIEAKEIDGAIMQLKNEYIGNEIKLLEEKSKIERIIGGERGRKLSEKADELLGFIQRLTLDIATTLDYITSIVGKVEDSLEMDQNIEQPSKNPNLET